MKKCDKIFLILTIILLSGCNSPRETPKQYLFLGHTYDWGAPNSDRIDRRLEQLPLQNYDQLWLGGDLCNRSSKSTATLSYLDSILGISKPTTHWALGNHDLTEGNLQWIESATGRKTYYGTYFDGLYLFVLNTNFNHPQLVSTKDDCPAQNEQYELFKGIMDTITTASHLVVLHHHNLLTDAIARQQTDMNLTCNFYRDQLPFSCYSDSSFQQQIYPRLVDVQKRGVQVVLVGGDFGQRHKGFQFRTQEGVWFLGSGINNSMGREHIPPYVTNLQRDSILLFERNIEKRTLEWHFLALDAYKH
ncbi:MAG: metallophosphoesterase [Bacteroidota bacterium]